MERNMTSIQNVTVQFIGMDAGPGLAGTGNSTDDYLFGYPDSGRYVEASTFDFNDMEFNDTPTGFPCSLFNDSVLCNISLPMVNATNSTVTVTGNGIALWLDAILAALAGLVSIMTILGNILVLMAFVLERAIRQPTNYFIASLAVSDLLIGIFSMNFYTLYLLMGTWPLGELMCDLWLSLDFTVCLTSQYTVFFITVDRFCSVKIPAKYRNWRTEKKVLAMVAFTWIIPTIVFFTSIIGYQYFVGERTVPVGQCYVQFQENPLFNCLLVIGYYWTTLFVMCGLYTGIYKVALDLQRKSEAKHKKMTSLVSMAGQTMSKIGIGMSRAQETKKGNNKNNNSCADKKQTTGNEALNPPDVERGRATSTTSFSSHKPNNKDEERSSSPAFPSDTDNDSHSPKRCNSNESKGHREKKQCQQGHKARESKKEKEKRLSREKKEARRDKTNSGESNLKVPVTIPPVPGSNSNTPPTDSGYHTVSVHSCDPNEQHHRHQLEQEQRLSSIENPQAIVADDDNKPSSLELPASIPIALDASSPNAPNISLVATPERIEGVGYIDQESLKSTHSADNVRLLIDILPKPNGNPVRSEEPTETSPIWKKRESMNFENVVSDDLRNPAIRIQDPSTCSSNSVKPMSIQVDTIDDNRSASKTVTKLAKNDELQPLNAGGGGSKSGKKNKRHKIGGQLVSSLAKSVGSRKRNRSKKEKQKSKSENRARKALRTITFILGAFVLCWTPYHVLIIIMGFCPVKDDIYYCVNQRLFEFSYWLCYLNSPVNPFCYALANAQFKKTFLRILNRDFHRT